MIVMLANNTGIEVGYLAGRYPGRVGHLYCDGPKGPYAYMPYALDNKRYVAWDKGSEWDEGGYIALLDYYLGYTNQPRWALVPDRVADRDATLADWQIWAPRIRCEYGFPLAFAVQDGMTAADVPADADVVFVGGSKEWKWRTAYSWCRDFPRVHVGKVNAYDTLWRCHDYGAESCDGTGWFRGDQKQLRRLYRYLAESSGERGREPQGGLFDVSASVESSEMPDSERAA